MDKQNKKIAELTREEMEKVAGGVFNFGINCFYCPGTKTDGKTCGNVLQQVSGSLYRCTNPLCSLLGKDQYPNG